MVAEHRRLNPAASGNGTATRVRCAGRQFRAMPEPGCSSAAHMKTAIFVLFAAGVLTGCSTGKTARAVQDGAPYETNVIRSKIVSSLPPGWSLLSHQDQTQHRFTSAYFTDPQTDAFILVGPQPNYIDWTDKEGTSHREYLAKECLYVWAMPASFEPKFQEGLKAGLPPPLVFNSQTTRVYARVSHYVADTNRTDLILKQATHISSPAIQLSWKDWRKDLRVGLNR
jgi:hypothetical protein